MKELLQHLRDGGTLVTDDGQELTLSPARNNATYILGRLIDGEWKIKPPEPEYTDGIYSADLYGKMFGRTALKHQGGSWWAIRSLHSVEECCIADYTNITRIGDLPRPFVSDPTFVPDFGDTRQEKWALDYNHVRGEYEAWNWGRLERVGGYFRTKKDALDAAKKLGRRK
jgi:hypothetical protein